VAAWRGAVHKDQGRSWVNVGQFDVEQALEIKLTQNAGTVHMREPAPRFYYPGVP
jgi:hypothetical protein